MGHPLLHEEPTSSSAVSSGARGMLATAVPLGPLEGWRVAELDGVGRMSVCTPGLSTVAAADPQAGKGHDGPVRVGDASIERLSECFGDQ